MHCIWRAFWIFIIVSSTTLSVYEGEWMHLSEAKYRMIKNRAIVSYVYVTHIEFGTSMCVEYKATF